MPVKLAASAAAILAAIAVLGAPAQAAAPAAADDTYTVVAGATLTVAAAQGVLANDTGLAAGQYAAINQTAPAGFLLGMDGGFTYTPPAATKGLVEIVYCISEPTTPPTCTAAKATIRITVAAPTPVADAYAAIAGQTLTVAAPGVLSNDLNVLAATVVTAGQTNGGANPILNENGGFTYTPAIDVQGPQVFRYCIKEPGSVPPTCLSDYATFTITVAGPQANNDSYTVAPGQTLTVASPGVLGNDANVPAGTIASAQQTPPAGLQLAANGALTWTAPATPGTFSFPYCIVAFPESPAERKCVSNNATVTITVSTSTSTPTPSASSAPQLPTTGDSAWRVAVAGALLLLAGVSALILARRRRPAQ